LRPKGNGRQKAFEPPQSGERLREKDAVFQSEAGKACLSEAPDHLAAADQPRVRVELAGPDGADGERVDRVVLEEERRPPGTKHAADFAKERHMLAVLDVMKDASRECDVEAGVAERQAASVEVNEVGHSRKARAGDGERLPRDVGAGQARVREVLAE